MRERKSSTAQRTLSLLLSGKSSAAVKYAGKHVLVAGAEVIPLKEKEDDIWKDIERLKKKYHEMPIMTFVPRQDISYILPSSFGEIGIYGRVGSNL